MSDLSEEVFIMPPMSMATIEQLGEAFLRELAPAALDAPTALDVRALIDDVLPARGVFFSPASAMELRDRLGATDPAGSPGDAINVLLLEELWFDLEDAGPRGNRARATVAHEVAHVLLHVPRIRRVRQYKLDGLLLNRMRREQMRAFCDPEWQAWALAGTILAPRRTIAMLPSASLDELARAFGVSASLMANHLRRLRMEVPY